MPRRCDREHEHGLARELDHCASLGLETRESGADDVLPSNTLERIVVMVGIGATVNLVDLSKGALVDETMHDEAAQTVDVISVRPDRERPVVLDCC